MNVLLIEPNRLLAQTYAAAITAEQHEIRIVSNAEMALKSLENSLPDVIICELQLAQHNGIEMLYELRSYIDWQQIPVVIHSMVSPSRFVDMSFMKQLGIRQYLYKPATSLTKLLNCLQTLEPQTA